MATIRSIELAVINRISGDVKPHTFFRGNGRRYIAWQRAHKNESMPDRIEIADFAQFEIDCRWQYVSECPECGHGLPIFPQCTTNHYYGCSKIVPDGDDVKVDADPPNITDVWTMVFLGKGEGTGRANGSKVLLSPGADEAYFIMTWTDLFGASVKETQLGLGSSDKGWTLYAKKANFAELSEIHEALEVAGVEF
jgi:hypothetical protein